MEPSDDRIIKTHVWHLGICFFVSTIERTSSAMGDTSRYNETIVWGYDWDKRERLGMVHQDSDVKGSIVMHQRIVENLFKYGKPEIETE